MGDSDIARYVNLLLSSSVPLKDKSGYFYAYLAEAGITANRSSADLKRVVKTLLYSGSAQERVALAMVLETIIDDPAVGSTDRQMNPELSRSS